MKSNILNLGRLHEKGYTIHMKDLGQSVRDEKNRLIARVHMAKNGMFPIFHKLRNLNVLKQQLEMILLYGILDLVICIYHGLSLLWEKNMAPRIPRAFGSHGRSESV